MSSDDNTTGKPRLSPWLLDPIRVNRAVYLKVALAAFMISLFSLAAPLFTMTVYDRVVPNNATASLVALSIGLGIVIVMDFVLRTLRSYFVDIAGADIDREVGQAVFDHMLNIRLDHKQGSTGALAGLMRELETLRDFFASATISAIVDTPFILLALLVIFLIGGPVVLVPALLVPLVVLVGALTQPALNRLSRQSMREGLLKQSVLVETIGGLEVVKAAGAGPLLTRRWLEAIRHHSSFSLRQRLAAAIGINTASSAQMISYAGVVIIGVGLIADQRLTMGGLIACAILAGRTVAPLGQIASLLSRIATTRTAYRQIDAVMSTPREGPTEDPLTLADIQGRIEFRNVDFCYPGAAEKALEKVSFTIEPGEHVALIGRVGSGKSTIAKLILGLFPPSHGVILLDGTDIRQMRPEQYRESIGAIMQDNVLLSGSVRENISLGREGVDDAEVARAAELSGTHRFMGQIVNGYDLKLADRGEGLSGGQRQSISIARALAGSPPIFILDEPTSAMDDQTESALIAALKEELAGRTVIVITHRPSVLRLIDRIILINNKTVAADGPRDEVLARIRGQAARGRKDGKATAKAKTAATALPASTASDGEQPRDGS